MEEIVAAAPNGYRWFQLYVYRDRKLSEQIVHRVESLGYKALVLTVDVPYTGKRRNDIRNQFKLPPHLKVKNFDGVFQVNVYFNKLRHNRKMKWVKTEQSMATSHIYKIYKLCAPAVSKLPHNNSLGIISKSTSNRSSGEYL